MKTKEFIEIVEKSGFVATPHKHGTIRISRQDGTWLSSVEIEKQFAVSFFEHKHITPKIFSLITEYSKTPLEEREEEKKYVYRMNCAVVAQEYLKATKKGVVRFEGDRDFSTNEPYFKSKFTDAEVENYPEEVRELFKICEKIEVTP